MTQDEMHALYREARRYGVIEYDWHDLDDIIRIMKVRYEGGLIQVCVVRGEVFAITQVKD